MSGDCDRARQWASTELDGELSTFERVLLQAHLNVCSSCEEFHGQMAGLTGALRQAPLEPFQARVEFGHLRRRPRVRLAPAAAAMAIAAVGLGSFLASASVHSGSVSARHAQAPIADQIAALDNMSLRKSNANARLIVPAPKISAFVPRRSLRGQVVQ
jgi:predicted anti-sigma-YlaC factor YlaD